MRGVGLVVAGALLALALALAGSRGARAHGSHATVIRGSVNYQRLCASCHGLKLRGDGPHAADGLARPTDLTLLGAHHGGRFDRAAVAATLEGPGRLEAHGTPDAAVWGEPGLGAPGADGAPSRRLKELLDYLEHTQDAR